MPRQLNFQDWSPGEYSFGPIVVPALATKATLAVDATHPVLADQAWEIAFEWSFDSGVTWSDAGGCVRKGGAPVATAGIPIFWPSTGPTRRLRGALLVGEAYVDIRGRMRVDKARGQPIRLAVDIEFE